MSGQLQVDDGDAAARCYVCGGMAAGPCMGCKRPVCGDCVELTDGGVRTWAVCLACAKRGGTSVGRAWLGLVGWIVVPLVVLAGVVAVLLATR